MKIVAAAAVVWIHTATDPRWAATVSLARFAVPFFALASAYALVAGMRSRPDEPIASISRKKIVRLYLPFLVWGAVYLLLRVVKLQILHEGGASTTSPELAANSLWNPATFFLVGHAQQLWFLPYICVASIALAAIVRPVIGKPAPERATGWALLLAGTALMVVMPPAGPPLERPPLENLALLGLATTPALLWGAAAALLLRVGLGSLKVPTLAGVLAAAGVGLFLWGVWTGDWGLGWTGGLGWWGATTEPAPYRMLPFENIAGLLAAFVAIALPAGKRPIPWLASLGPLAFGLYLSHILFIQAARLAQHKAHLADSFPVDAFIWTFAVVGGVALSMLLRSTAKTRWLIP